MTKDTSDGLVVCSVCGEYILAGSKYLHIERFNMPVCQRCENAFEGFICLFSVVSNKEQK
jgi:hypothetical protein